MIYVCPLSRLAETVHAAKAKRLVSLLSAGTAVERPGAVRPEHHLHLTLHDLAAEQDGMTPPGRLHVESLLEFARSWDRSDPLVIHCYAGISRSTAAAYIVAAALNPQREEAELASALRALSPSATPNSRLIEIADEILGRAGRMTAAIKAIGRGADAFEGTPFVLRIDTVSTAPRPSEGTSSVTI
jgi:predicted protein tyrosine phosphatase